MTFERCDVLYGADPFKGEDYARPWLVVNNESHPFHGDQYVVLALTTRTWYDDLVPIREGDWLEGGVPKSSHVIPWSVETLEHDDVDYRQGTVVPEVVNRAVDELTSYVTDEAG